jgi:tripartite-type tricarboxylate transporter receptor subunit TctC
MTGLGRRASILAGAALAAPSAYAQAWRPSQTVRCIIGAAAGGTLDIHARAAAPALTERMGQPLVVENNGGAAGRVASALVGRAAPDGQTLLVSAVRGEGVGFASRIGCWFSRGGARSSLTPGYLL